MLVLLSAFLLGCEGTWTGSVGSNDTPKPLRLLMCITGQGARLEARSKLENFVKYNTAKGHKVDVIGILDNSEARFVNPTASTETSKDEKMDSMDLFKGHVENLQTVDFVQPEAPETPEWYTKNLNAGKPWLDSTDRAVSHVRQFVTIQRCYDAMLDLEFKNGERYDEILRIRDDGFLIRPLNPLHETKNHPDFLTNHCDNWYGLNDKAALMLRSTAEKYFNGFLKTLYFDPILEAKNPETLTLEMLKKANVTIHQDGERLTVAPIRGDSKSGCLHMIYKQCWKGLLKNVNYSLDEVHPLCAEDHVRNYQDQDQYVHQDKLES